MKLLACLGLVWILKDSIIFKTPRDFITSRSKKLKQLFSCSMCLGFWTGLLLAVIENLPLEKWSNDFIYYPFAVSGFCWFFDCVLDLIQEVWFYYKNLRENS